MATTQTAPLRTAPLVMAQDPFGFDKVMVNGQERKLSEFTPQITLVMSAIWIAEYATHHGVAWGSF